MLTLTGQKLIEWSKTLHVTFFNVFSKSKKRDFLRFFCFVVYVFSNSDFHLMTPISLDSWDEKYV